MTDDEKIACTVAEKMAALLFIIGGERMVECGYIEFSERRPWLTRKGCGVFRSAMDIIPEWREK